MSSKWVLSATEIETFALCRRKWGYLYLDGIKPPQSKAAELGVSIHKILEKYLSGYSINYQSQEGKIIQPGLRYLPEAISKNNIERPFFFIEEGHIFHGYIDFFDQVGSQTWLIGDHKSCSSLSSAFSPEELKKNIQANIYARWAFTDLAAEKVQLKWVYYRTKGSSEAKAVETSIERVESDNNFKSITKFAEEIKDFVEAKTPTIELEKNLGSCFKYGRCPFYGECKFGSIRKAESDTPAPTPTIATKPSFHLYIDCTPTKAAIDYERTIELSDLLKPLLLKIQTEKELKHYRLAGYGQHVGLIANYLSDHLKDTTYDSRTAILTSMKTPEGCDTLQTLMGAASHVVRGF